MPIEKISASQFAEDLQQGILQFLGHAVEFIEEHDALVSLEQLAWRKSAIILGAVLKGLCRVDISQKVFSGEVGRALQANKSFNPLN